MNGSPFFTRFAQLCAEVLFVVFSYSPRKTTQQTLAKCFCGKAILTILGTISYGETIAKLRNKHTYNKRKKQPLCINDRPLTKIRFSVAERLQNCAINIHIIKGKTAASHKRSHKKARRAFLNAARRFFIRIRRNRADPLCKREADLPAAAAWAEARAGSNDRLCTFLYAFRAVWARL